MSDQVEAPRTEPPVEKFRLSLKGEGISVDREIDGGAAMQIFSIVMGGVPAPGAPGTRGIRSHVPGTPAPSIREKLDEALAKRWPDKIVVVAQHLHDTGETSFSKADVRNQLTAAREGKPGNYDRDFGWTVQIGWLAPNHDDPNQFYVTQKGREAIKAQFSKEVKRATSHPKASRRRKKPTNATTTTPE